MSVIIQSNANINIEEHFKTSAGPGAGKTYWLVNHFKNVLQNSNRLGCTKKIACITYTNIGVDTILRRLDFAADRVEVTTIHGFIYKHIIKPYVQFIAAEYELNVSRLDGHDDHYISRTKIADWINGHPNSHSFRHPYTANQMTRMDQNVEAIGRWLSSIYYRFESGHLIISADNSEAYYLDGNTRRNLGKTTCLDKLAPGFMEYKKLFWRKGTLHHDDVLFFGYQLITRFPFIVKIIQTKFPYFFIDEFQDTSPIQAEIVRLIGQGSTIVGVIGDRAQSIFSFQGAVPEYFDSFALPAIKHYVIADNRRSSNTIVDLLNHVRTDIRQQPIRGVAGIKSSLIVGNLNDAYAYTKSAVGLEELATLSWDNITSNAMKRHIDSSLPSINLLTELIARDSNADRRKAVVSGLNAVELAKAGRFKEAIKEMERNFRSISDKFKRRKAAFNCLSFLLSRYSTFQAQPLLNFYTLLKDNFRTDISNLRAGAIQTFYNSYTYNQLAVCVNISDDRSFNRTIHKAKGDEFDNVLVIFKDQRYLSFITNPNLSTEQHRLFYVAISRAREKLFLTVPELSVESENRLQTQFNVVRV